jgi:hypothetical protein
MLGTRDINLLGCVVLADYYIIHHLSGCGRC